MSEVKDPAIKLFGRTILLPHSINHCSSSSASASEPAPACALSSSSSPREVTSSATQQQQQHETDEEPSRKKHTSSQHDDDDVSHQTTEDLKSPTTSSSILENPKTPSAETETSIPKEQSETTTTSASDEKTPKKPDKVLPCPRCNSMDTKFCYYNNYNVNQPRYFCKNCQRYWTAGGTTRNVPVGAGRRKNKTCSSATPLCYRQIVVPEGTVFGNRSTVLSFGHDSPPICDTMTSMLSIVERAAQNCVGTSGHSTGVASVATTSTSSHTGSHESVNKSLEGFTPQSRYFRSSHWPYHPHMAPPTFFPPNYPLPFYTTPPYWSCMPPSWSNNISCISPQSSVNNSASASSASTLGKHSRDGNIIASSNLQRGMHHVMEHNNNNNGSEHGFLFPKTLRIDDPSEAAKRSISMWPELGIKNDGDNNKASSGGGLFSKAFPYPSPSKGNDDMNRHRTAEASPVLQANPAALSRSLTFHEQT